MRITNKGMVNTYMHGMQNNLNQLQKINNQMNTQKVINKVSDDPYNASKIMNMQTEIQDIERFNYNCDEILGWLEVADDSLNKVGTISTEIKTLLTSINDTYSQNEVNSIKKDVIEKVKELAESLNGSYAGKYIFSGTKMDEKAVSVIENPDGTFKLEINPNIDSGNLKTEISNGMSIDYNITISEVMGQDGLDTINEILQVLNKEPFDVNEIMAVKEKLDDFQSNVLDCRSTLGSKAKTVESIKSNNEANIETATEVLSSIRDCDFAEKYVELMTAQLAYNASIQVGSKLVQSTILDFIR